MWYASINKGLPCWQALIVAGIVCMFSVNCFADDSLRIKEFKKPPVIDYQSNNRDIPDETFYRAKGIVDAVNSKAISIGDVQYTIEPGTRISCRKGYFVGIIVNDKGNVIDCERISQ